MAVARTSVFQTYVWVPEVVKHMLVWKHDIIKTRSFSLHCWYNNYFEKLTTYEKCDSKQI